MRNSTSLLLATLATIAAAGSANANLITNGSFEEASPGVSLPTGNGTLVPSGSTDILGWTVIDGIVGDGVAWLPNQNDYGVTTPFGNYFLDLTGYGDNMSLFGVAQTTVGTTPGHTYALTFFLGVNNDNPLYSGPVGVEASAAGASGNFVYDPAGSGNLWGGFTLDFTATSTSTLITIAGTQQADQYLGLDNVSLVDTVTPGVPEPATWGMMLMGFAGLGLAGFSRKKRINAAAV